MRLVSTADLNSASVLKEDRAAKAAAPMLNAIIALSAIQVATMAFNLLRSKIVALVGGPQGVGIISVIDQVVALVAQVSTFSLPYASVKFLSAAHSESQEAYARGYLAFLRALLVISLVGTGAGTLIVLLRPAVLGQELIGYGSIVVIALLAIPATNLAGLLINALASARRARASAGFGLATAAALAIASGSGLLFGGLRGYYAGNFGATALLIAGGMFYLFRKEGLASHYGRVSVVREIKRYPEVLSFAAALYVISFTTPLAELVARYSLLRAGGFEVTGLLQAAMGLSLALRTIMRSSNQLYLTPALNRFGENKQKFHDAAQFSRALSITMGVIALPMVLFPDWLLLLLYSPKFAAAAPFVYLFVLAEVVQLLAGVNQALMIGLNNIATNVMVSLLADVALATCSWWLAPQYGIAGIAVALLVSRPLMFALSAFWLRIRHGIAIHRRIGWLPFYVLGVLAAAGAMSAWYGENTAAIIIIKISFWAIFTISLLSTMWSGVGDLLRDAWRSVRMRIV